MAINEPWYAKMAELYGEEYCRIAGYFDEDETRPFEGSYRRKYPNLNKLVGDVVLYSGAFHPFHEGHLSVIRAAQDVIRKYQDDRDEYELINFVIHVDHSEYRNSKGAYDDRKVIQSLHDHLIGQCIFSIVYEDQMPNGASRNFTRLYQQLQGPERRVWFLSGGDRANYALTFRDQGRCIIAGRDQHPTFQKWRWVLPDDRRIFFVEGNHPASSTAIRNGNN